MQHSIFPCGCFALAGLGQIVQGFLQDFCQNRGPGNVQVFLNRTIGRARPAANPGIRQFLEQERSFGKAAPARAGSHDLKNPHVPLPRDRQDIAWSDRLGRDPNPPRIEPHMALGDKPRREATRPRHPREPKPFVEPLPQRRAFPLVIPVPQIDIPWKHDFKRADHLWLEPGDWRMLPRRARRAQSASATRLRRKTVPCRAK